MAAIRRGRHRVELVARPLERLAVALVIAQRDADQVHDGVLHRDLDLLAFAGGLPLHERGEDPDYAMHPGSRIADRRPRVRRWPVRESRHAHGATHRLRDRLIALVVLVGTVRAEPLDAGVHETRVLGPD